MNITKKTLLFALLISTITLPIKKNSQLSLNLSESSALLISPKTVSLNENQLSLGLSKSIALGDIHFLKYILDQGARVNEVYKNGFISLIHAIIARNYSDDYGHCYPSEVHLKIIKELIKRGADVNKKDQANYTPLMVAENYQDEEAIELLRKAGAKK